MNRKEKIMIGIGILVIVLFVSGHYTQVLSKFNNIEIAIMFGSDYKTYFLSFISDLCFVVATFLQILLIIFIIEEIIKK